MAPMIRGIATVLGLAVLASGCAAMGGGKNPPDEFAIVTKAPLTVPPDFALRPPRPGETRPQRLSTSERTRQLLLGDGNSAPPTDGELLLMQQIGALDVDPNIRAILAAENGGQASQDENLANQLILWKVNDDGSIDDTGAPLQAADRDAWEAERHDLIEAVTGEGDVVISKEKRAILNLPGVR